MLITYAKFHLNLSTKYRDISSRGVHVNGLDNERTHERQSHSLPIVGSKR